jgi:murein DD-endopeptidase MepM/ murein hydrolase activator NlpD
VRPEERVRCGQRIGQFGHSGHSTEPHLHFQLQDRADFVQAVGLPIAFSGCLVNGAPASGPVYLHSGMRVRQESTTAAHG